MTTKDEERARNQAKAQLESIVEMVKRLEHCQDYKGDDCELTDKEIYAGLNLYYQDGDVATEEEREQYHNEDGVREAIQEDPLEVEVTTGWHTPGKEEPPTDYLILLCTGGPAVRITGKLDQHQEPDTAVIEYQDWFTPWERYSATTTEDDEALLTYAKQFYFGS